MSDEIEQLVGIFVSLSEGEQVEVLDFARFLLARQEDDLWEKLIASPERRPKLDAFLRESALEPATPLDQFFSH